MPPGDTTANPTAVPTAPPVTSDKRKPLTLPAAGLALLLSTMWAGNPVANKAGLEDAGPLRLGYLRFALGGIVVLIYSIATRQDFRVYGFEIKPLVFLGVLFSVQLAFMNVGQDFTTAGHAVIVTTTFPLYAGADTFRGCRIKAIYALEPGQADELREIGRAARR